MNLGGGTRVALLLCGSFNPPTFLHLRMFERARDFLEQDCHCQVVEGVLSPVSDHFNKQPPLLPARHRLRMAQLATASSSWIRADGWECSLEHWSRTIEVMRHQQRELRRKHSDENLRLVLIAGGDLVDSFVREEPTAPDGRLWMKEHLMEMFEHFGLVVIKRVGSREGETLSSPDLDFLRPHLHNVAVIEDDTFPNEMSSTRLRAALRKGRSIRYCTPDQVVDYILKHSLYAHNGRLNEQT